MLSVYEFCSVREFIAFDRWEEVSLNANWALLV